MAAENQAQDIHSGKIYDLTEGQEDSQDFYSLLEHFVSEFMLHANQTAGPLVEGYMHWIQKSGAEPLRSRTEYLADLLVLGTLWNEFISRAVTAPGRILRIMTVLYDIRSRYRLLKPTADAIRGRMMKRILTGQDKKDYSFTPENLTRLRLWLLAAGDYREEAYRIRIAENYLQEIGPLTTQRFLEVCRDLSNRNSLRASKAFAPYVQGVPGFLTRRIPAYKNREDLLFCGRGMDGYFLNLTVAQMLNVSFRPAFDSTLRKVVLLPTCMKGKQVRGCKAVSEGDYKRCTGCHPDCHIGQVQRAVNATGALVLLIPHSSDFSRFLKSWAHQNHTGLVGIACILSLLLGGYEMRRLNIPSQCVFLDYCGCKKHWDPSGIATGISIPRLIQILQPQTP